MKDVKKDMARYCQREIYDYELRVQIALGYIDRMRCPLNMADGSLYEDMEEKIAEYCEDNDLNPEDYEVEDIFWIEP